MRECKSGHGKTKKESKNEEKKRDTAIILLKSKF